MLTMIFLQLLSIALAVALAVVGLYCLFDRLYLGRLFYPVRLFSGRLVFDPCCLACLFDLAYCLCFDRFCCFDSDFFCSDIAQLRNSIVENPAALDVAMREAANAISQEEKVREEERVCTAQSSRRS